MINPAVEVYLLDTQGMILGHALPEASVSAQQLDMTPVLSFLSDTGQGAILGDNPRDNNNANIFSVAEIVDGDKSLGYLYIILASHSAKTLAEQLSNSHVIRLTLCALVVLVLFLGLSSGLTFMVISRPLYSLSQSVREYRQSNLEPNQNLEPVPENQPSINEVEELQQSFVMMQDRIQLQFDRLNESDQLRRELVSNISHDLRTPLASMQGYLETLLLMSDEIEPAKKQQYLKIAHRHSQHMSDMIAQLFELSKLDTGRVEPKFEVFSITELLFDIKQDYELAAQKKGVAIEIALPSSNAMVNADIALIQRVLQNLMDNALRHTPKNGEIHVNISFEGKQVRVNIQDTGDGIEQDELPFVFERYYQAKSGKSTKNAIGAGLGLSIVKRILDLHNAIIEVESERFRGTQFSFYLPAM